MYFDKRKKASSRKNAPSLQDLAYREIENAIFQNGQTHISKSRGRKRSERGTKIKHPLSADMNNLLEQTFAKIQTVFENCRSYSLASPKREQ